MSIDYRYRCTTWQCTPLTVTILRRYHFIKYSNIFIIMCWMSKPDLEIQHLTSKTVFQSEDFLENISIESHKVWWDNKSIKGILVRLLVDYHHGLAWQSPSLPLLHLLSKHARRHTNTVWSPALTLSSSELSQTEHWMLEISSAQKNN